VKKSKQHSRGNIPPTPLVFGFSTHGSDNVWVRTFNTEKLEETRDADFPIRPFNKEFSSFAKVFSFLEKTDIGDSSLLEQSRDLTPLNNN